MTGITGVVGRLPLHKSTDELGEFITDCLLGTNPVNSPKTKTVLENFSKEKALRSSIAAESGSKNKQGIESDLASPNSVS